MKLKDLKIGKTVNEGCDMITKEDVEKQHEKAVKNYDAVMKERTPEKVESSKATPNVKADDKPMKSVTESVKDRAELKTLLGKLDGKVNKPKIRRSKNEGYRYDVTYIKEEKEDDDFKSFLDKAEIILVDDAENFDINEWEREQQDEVDETLGDKTELPAKKFLKYKLDDENLSQVIDKLKTGKFDLLDGTTSWKTKQFLKKKGLKVEDLQEVLRGISKEDYKENSKPVDDKSGYNEAVIFFKTSKVKDLGPFNLYIKLDFDSVEETPIIIISLHQARGNDIVEPVKDDDKEVKSVEDEVKDSEERSVEVKEDKEVSHGKDAETFELPHEEYTELDDLIRVNDELDKKALNGELVLLRKNPKYIEISEPRINAIWTLHLDRDGNIEKITVW